MTTQKNTALRRKKYKRESREINESSDKITALEQSTDEVWGTGD